MFCFTLCRFLCICYFYPVLTKTEIQRILIAPPLPTNIKFCECLFSGSQAFTIDRSQDRLYEPNRCISETLHCKYAKNYIQDLLNMCQQMEIFLLYKYLCGNE